MIYFYAQLNEDNMCIGISQLGEKQENEKMILLDEKQYSLDLLFRKYENGIWGEKIIVEDNNKDTTSLKDRVDDIEKVLDCMMGVEDIE